MVWAYIPNNGNVLFIVPSPGHWLVNTEQSRTDFQGSVPAESIQHNRRYALGSGYVHPDFSPEAWLGLLLIYYIEESTNTVGLTDFRAVATDGLASNLRMVYWEGHTIPELSAGTET